MWTTFTTIYIGMVSCCVSIFFFQHFSKLTTYQEKFENKSSGDKNRENLWFYGQCDSFFRRWLTLPLERKAKNKTILSLFWTLFGVVKVNECGIVRDDKKFYYQAYVSGEKLWIFGIESYVCWYRIGNIPLPLIA